MTTKASYHGIPQLSPILKNMTDNEKYNKYKHFTHWTTIGNYSFEPQTQHAPHNKTVHTAKNTIAHPLKNHPPTKHRPAENRSAVKAKSDLSNSRVKCKRSLHVWMLLALGGCAHSPSPPTRKPLYLFCGIVRRPFVPTLSACLCLCSFIYAAVGGLSLSKISGDSEMCEMIKFVCGGF